MPDESLTITLSVPRFEWIKPLIRTEPYGHVIDKFDHECVLFPVVVLVAR